MFGRAVLIHYCISLPTAIPPFVVLSHQSVTLLSQTKKLELCSLWYNLQQSSRPPRRWRTTVTTTHNPPIFLCWVFSFLGKLLEWILIYSRQWKYWYLTGCHKPKIQLYLSLSSTTITGTSFGVSSVWFLLGLFNCFRCNWYDSDNIFTDFFAIDCSVVYIFGQCDLIFLDLIGFWSTRAWIYLMWIIFLDYTYTLYYEKFALCYLPFLGLFLHIWLMISTSTLNLICTDTLVLVLASQLK